MPRLFINDAIYDVINFCNFHVEYLITVKKLMWLDF